MQKLIRQQYWLEHFEMANFNFLFQCIFNNLIFLCVFPVQLITYKFRLQFIQMMIFLLELFSNTAEFNVRQLIIIVLLLCHNSLFQIKWQSGLAWLINHLHGLKIKVLQFIIQQIIFYIASMEKMTKDNYHHTYNENFSLADSNSQVHQKLSSVQLIQFFNNYKPISKYVNIKELHLSQKTIIKKYKQSVYYGQFEQQNRSGQGLMIYYDKRVYEGCWKNGYKDGKGFEIFSDQSSYEGNYVHGKPSGVGKFTWKNGDYYEGQWLDGLRQGVGFWQGFNGDSYSGQWKKGQANGFGINLSLNGSRYEGQFKNSLKHGHGIQKFPNNHIYKGNFEKGLFCGGGEYYWANGAYFKGIYQNGFKNGQGFWKSNSTDNQSYEGLYKNDKKQGYGTYIWKDGGIYRGSFSNNLRHGYGQMKWQNGIQYKGQWYKGAQHGPGQISHPKQGVKKGMFQNNTLIKIYQQQNVKTKSEGNGPMTQSVTNPQKQSNLSYQEQLMPKTIKFNTQNNQFRKKVLIQRKTKSISIILNPQSKSRQKRNKSFTSSLKSVYTMNLKRDQDANSFQKSTAENSHKKNKINHSNQAVLNIRRRIATSGMEQKISEETQINLITTKQYCNRQKIKIKNLASIYMKNFRHQVATSSR